jgi:putative endonuclease
MRAEKHPAVYIITNKRYGTLYVGVTSELWSRIWAHKSGHFEGFSKQYALSLLVWYENHPTMASAIHRETRLKKWRREWKLNLINAFNPDWSDLHDEFDANINRVEEFATRKVWNKS